MEHKEKEPVKHPPVAPSSPAAHVQKAEVAQEETSFIITKDISFPVGRQLVSYKRGDVIDDPIVLAQIRGACDPVPLRPLNVLDLVDRG